MYSVKTQAASFIHCCIFHTQLKAWNLEGTQSISIGQMKKMNMDCRIRGCRGGYQDKSRKGPLEFYNLEKTGHFFLREKRV